MKKRKGIVSGAVLLAAVVAMGALFYFYPVWKAAGLLAENLDFLHCTYELEAELDRSKLPEETGKQLEMLAKLTGTHESALDRLTVKGGIWDDKIHAVIYTEGAEEPFAEFYLSNDTDVISVTTTYESIRKHLTQRYKVLYHLMPKQKELVYMTMEQAEQLLGMSLENARDFALPIQDSGFSRGRYFALLGGMSKEKGNGGELFSLETEHVRVYFRASGEPETYGEMGITIQNPGELVSGKERILEKLGIHIPDDGLRALRSLSLTISSREAEEIVVPENFVSQGMVEVISGIREWIQENFLEEEEDGIPALL